MLNIYLVRENIDKNKVIFEQIEETSGNKVLIVPDQYTLESEKNAFKYLGKSAVIDLEILSPTRLGYKILKETGKPKEILLDKYGRQMLIYNIIKQNVDKLTHFTKLAGKSGFIELVDEQIGEFQQYYIDSAKLAELIKTVDDKSVLYQKLTDLLTIYSEYESQIAKKYIDTKDINEIFIERAEQSTSIAGTDFWISEYDYMAPKNLEFIVRLIARGKSVNLFLTGDIDSTARDYELFDITRKFIYKLQKSCETIGQKCVISQISDSIYAVTDKSNALSIIEKEIFAYPPIPYSSYASDIFLHRAKNIYTEAETAAVFVRNLLSESNYKLNDIAVICNDIDNMGPVIKRTFEEYGIKCFLDKNRDVLHNSLISLNLTLMQAAQPKLTTSAVISFLKSGFSDLSRADIEKLENYVRKYKIKGNMWLKEFYKTDLNAKLEPEIAEINALRDMAISPLIKFRAAINSVKSAREKIEILYNFLKLDLGVPDKLKANIREYENMGLTEIALENSQIWNIIINLYEQLALILKDEEVENEVIEEILKSGFASIKMGMIPSTSDQVLIGNIQRSRIGQIPVLLILAANDGILPLSATNETLISNDEKTQILNVTNIEFGELAQAKIAEENLAIYRMLAAPLHKLFVSYEESTLAGDSMKPAQIFLRLAEIFAKNRIKGDIYSSGENLNLLSIPTKTMLHIASKLRNDDTLTDAETAALFWCIKHEKDVYEKLASALKFEVKAAKLSKDDAHKLYLGDKINMRLSPSRLEKYAACPFAYFLTYGIKVADISPFELSGRHFGDIYHSVAQKISENLNSDNLPVSSPDSRWMNITSDELSAIIDETIEFETKNYQNGFLFDEADGPYKIERIRNVCLQVICAVIAQIRSGQIEKMLCETTFGNSIAATFPAIKIDANIPISIEGKIDRVDIINGACAKYCKIVDYKSGFTKFDKDSVLAGFQLQLAIYLKAATSGSKATKPAGMFYFHFSDKSISLQSGATNELSDDDMLKEYKLDGIFLNSEEIVNSLDSDFSRFSKVASIQKTKDGIKKNDKYMLDEIEFDDFLSSVNTVISKLCERLSDGNIEIYPGKTGNGDACEFCHFNSICKFDKGLPNCTYRKSWSSNQTKK